MGIRLFLVLAVFLFCLAEVKAGFRFFLLYTLHALQGFLNIACLQVSSDLKTDPEVAHTTQATYLHICSFVFSFISKMLACFDC